MIRSQFLSAFLLLCLTALTALAGPPTLTFPEDKAGDQPSDLTLTWEAGSLTNCIADGGFEKGPVSWNTAFWKFKTDAVNAYDGAHFAEFPITLPFPRFSQGEVWQIIKLPKSGSAARLSWNDSTGVAGDPSDQIRFRVVAEMLPSHAEEELYSVTCGEGDSDLWNRREVDLTGYLGKTFVLAFYVSNQTSSTRHCGAWVDGVRIEVTPATVSYELYLGPTVNLGAAQLVGKTTDASWNLSSLAAGSTNYWKVIQITDGVREGSPVFQFVVGGSVPVEAPPLRVELSGGQLHLHALTQPGGFYQFEQSDAPDSDTWQPIGDEIAGDGADTSMDVPLNGEAQFFRLRVTP